MISSEKDDIDVLNKRKAKLSNKNSSSNHFFIDN